MQQLDNKTEKQPKKAENQIVISSAAPDERNLYKKFLLSPDELQNKVDEYFEIGGSVREVIMTTGKNKYTKELRIYTLTGLCLFCGFVDKDQLFQLERNIKYQHVIKKARSRIEQIYEEGLQISGNSANIFALKNFGWQDKQEIVHEEKTLKLDI